MSENDERLPIPAGDPKLVATSLDIRVSDFLATPSGDEFAPIFTGPLRRVALAHNLPEKIYIFRPSEYNRINEHVSEGVNLKAEGPSIQFQGRSLGSTNHYYSRLEPGEIFATSKEELRAEWDKRQERLNMLEAECTDHKYGRGGVIVTNRLGGIDVEHPEETVPHLLTRFGIGIGVLGLTSMEELAKDGIVDQRIYYLLQKQLDGLFQDIKPIVDVVVGASKKGLLDEDGQLQPMLTALGSEHVKEFIAKHTDAIDLLAHAAQNPDSTSQAVKALNATDGRQFKYFSKPPNINH